MASSVSGQDESNPVLWLATLAGKMELSCPVGTTRCVPQGKFPRKRYNKSFIDQACSVKMAGYWLRSFFARLWTSTPSRSINTQKNNLTNIQPSWPHTWSITHIFFNQGSKCPCTLLQVLYKRGIAAGILPSIPYAEILTYSFSTAFLFHAVRTLYISSSHL